MGKIFDQNESTSSVKMIIRIYHGKFPFLLALTLYLLAKHLKPMIKRSIPVVMLAVGLWSCQGGEEKSNDHSATEMQENAQVEESAETESGEGVDDLADFKFHTMIANLPSPLETFHLISDVSVGMEGVDLTPTDEATNLSTMSAKAYGYGIYMTDMGFMAYEHQNQQTLEYFETCRQLSQALGAGEVFDRTISTNFEENTSSEEKFVKMMDEAFNAMDQYMVDNERFVNATEIFVGSWVETQIIATNIVIDEDLSDENRPIYNGIYEQKMHASNLMNVLSEIENELKPEVVDSVEDLMMFYAGFTGVESISTDDLKELDGKLRALKTALTA